MLKNRPIDSRGTMHSSKTLIHCMHERDRKVESADYWNLAESNKQNNTEVASTGQQGRPEMTLRLPDAP